ncbi:PIG-L deacetylase family protein [Microbacterium sp. A204]|uniref:PIG-L deacetylase family protein n=1 Tax=Microbacterium sp. A204 TaxID=3457321 RepID=UPI003FD0C69B
MRRYAAVLSAVALLGALALSGCSSASEADATGGRVISTAVLTPPPPPNDLSDEQVAQITTVQCPDAITEDTLRALVQPQADAVEFFATTLQCGDIAAVVAVGEGAPAFVSPMQYIDAPCPAGTLFTVWAHYDDDLIFGSPTIPQALDAGQCVRNLYLTGSDAGKGLDYAYGREDGLRDSYDVLLGAPLEWEERTVTLVNGLTLAMSRPIGDPRVTLFFLRLPDGGLGASGFEATGWESLPKLLAGTLSELHMIDAGTPVSIDGISSTVVELYNAYQPVTVMAHLPGSAEGTSGDHPDHQVTGDIVMGTADSGQIDPARVIYAQGYPSADRPQNLDGDVLQRKLDAFAAYAIHDPVIRCSTADTCANVRLFGAWLLRQYTIPHAELVRP